MTRRFRYYEAAEIPWAQEVRDIDLDSGLAITGISSGVLTPATSDLFSVTFDASAEYYFLGIEYCQTAATQKAVQLRWVVNAQSATQAAAALAFNDSDADTVARSIGVFRGDAGVELQYDQPIENVYFLLLGTSAISAREALLSVYVG